MSLTEQNIAEIRADLDRGLTPMIITEPGSGLIDALSAEFAPEAILDAASYEHISYFHEDIDRVETQTMGEDCVVVVRNTDLVTQYMSIFLRTLAKTHMIGDFTVLSGTRFIYVAESRDRGVLHNPGEISLIRNFNLALREITLPLPHREADEIAQDLKDLSNYLNRAIADHRRYREDAKADHLIQLNQSLRLVAHEQQSVTL